MLPRRAAGNAVVQILGKGTGMLVSMAGFSLLTRHLGLELFGRYSVVQTVIGMAAIIAELGLGTIAIRELASRRGPVDRVIPAVLVVRIGLGTLALGLATILAWMMGYDSALVELVAVNALVFIVRGVGAGTYGLLSAAELKARKNAAADVVESLVFFAIVAAGVALHRGIAWFVCGTVVGAFCNSAAIILLNRRQGPRVWAVDWRYCGALLWESIPLALASLFAVIYFRMDALMLSRLSGSAAVGLYSAAYKFVESSSLLGTVLMSSVFPVLAYFFEHDKIKFAEFYRKSLELVAVVAFAIALAIYLFSDSLVRLLSGPAFLAAAPVLRICCCAILLMFVNNIGVNLLFAARRQVHLVWINLVTAAVKFGFNLVAIPLWGPEGAAMATVITEAMIAVSVYALVTRTLGLRSPIFPIAKLGLLGAAFVVICEFANPAIWERVILLMSGGLVLLAIGMPRPRDVAMLLQRGG